MGGVDKPLLRVAGRRMIDRTIERIRPQCRWLLLNANGDAARLSDCELPVVADDVAGFAGPLAGVLAGLDWAAAHLADTEWVVSIPGDTPFVPTDLVSRLSAALHVAGAVIACAASAGRTHPVIALWPVALRGDLRRALVERGERRVAGFAALYPTAVVEWSSEPYDPFFNVNTPEDLAAAAAIAARADAEPVRASS